MSSSTTKAPSPGTSESRHPDGLVVIARQRRLVARREPLVRCDAVVDRDHHAANRLLHHVSELFMAVRQQNPRKILPAHSEGSAVLNEALTNLFRHSATAPEKRMADEELAPQ